MKEFIKKWITHNLGVKILSLVIAVLLWFVFTNLEDPLTTTYYQVPVEVRHVEEYRNQNRFIEIDGEEDLDNLSLTVYFRSRTSEVEALRNRNVSTFLSAYIDLYEIDPEDPNRLLIHYDIIDSSVKGELYSYRNKSYYTVDVEDYVSVEIPVQYTITGTPVEGYMFVQDDSNIQVSPRKITLSGPSDQVMQVAYAHVTVDVSNESANVSKIGEAVLKNQDGETLNYSRDVLRTSVNDVSVYIPIYAHKTVKILPYLVGTPREGYEYANNLSLDVDSVEIYGQESILNKINNISLPEIELDTITGSFSERCYLQKLLNDNYGDNTVRLMSGSPIAVTVSLSVEKQQERTITLPTDRIAVSGQGDFDYDFELNSVDIVVYGLPANVEAYDEADLVATLRLKPADLTAGIHSVSLDITGLGQLKAKETKVNVVLRAKNNAESSNSTSEESSP